MALEPHRIRLSTAWEPPADPAGGDWVRRFGRPAVLGAEPDGYRVDLVWLGVPDLVIVVNGVTLHAPEAAASGVPRRHDVSLLLRERNELRVRVESAAAVPVPGRHGRVDLPTAIGRLWLEITAAGPRGTP